MVTAIISLARALNLEVIAEGVELEEELSIQQKQDCEYVQGYLFSKPLTIEDFTKKIEESFQKQQKALLTRLRGAFRYSESKSSNS